MAGVAAAPIGSIQGRKGEALAFIREQLLAGMRPSIPEIARHLGVSVPRGKELVGQLESAGAIVRPRGAQRAITIPGIEREIALAELRRLGVIIMDGQVKFDQPFPKGQVAVVATMEHDPRYDD